ncbi:MAG: general secretion pathway protein GspK [Polyangiaceae bacterium]|nr:general secretion pathway protein GspK [Polyangiaceae bacterium]
MSTETSSARECLFRLGRVLYRLVYRSSPPMKTSPIAARRERLARRKARGVALVMVLGAITVLTVFLTELQEETSASLAAALAERDALKAEYYARSAVNLSRLLIASEPKIRGPLTPILAIMGQGAPKQLPVWQFVDQVLGPFNDESGAAAFGSFAGLDMSSGKNLGLSGGGRFVVTIVDEDSKTNINMAADSVPGSSNVLANQLLSYFNRPDVAPLFENRDADDQFSPAPERCGAIIDWADSSTTTTETLATCDLSTSAPTATAAEDNFYQTIGLDYVRKNAAFDSLEELRLVRGVDDAFWVNFVDPSPDDPKKRNMTVWGKRQINLLTAPPVVTLGVICANVDFNATELCTNPEQMAAFVGGLGMVKALLGFTPISSVKQLSQALKGEGMAGMILAQMGLKPVTGLREGPLKQQVKFESKVFSIYAEGIVPGYKKEMRLRLHSVVDFSAAQGLTAASQAVQQAAGGGASLNADAADAAAAEALATDPLGTIIYWRIE